MSEYIIFRYTSKPISLDFNKASALLKKEKGLKIKDSYQSSSVESFLVEMSEERAKELLPKMPGWKITPQKNYST